MFIYRKVLLSLLGLRTNMVSSNLFLHFSNQRFSYRTRDEIQNVRKTQDPIASLKERLLEADLVTADDIKVS